MKAFFNSRLFTFFVLTACIFFLFFRNINSYKTKVDVKQLRAHYENSQYVKPDSYKFYIDDPELYAFSGWQYIHGADQTSINFEHQPVGKYFIGLSILAFGNPGVAQFLTAGLCLFLTFKLSRLLLSNFLSLIPVVLLTLDPLFIEQSARAYLDIYQLAATLAFFLFLLAPGKRKSSVIGALVSFSLVLLSNSVWSGIVAGGVGVIFILLCQREKIKTYLAALPVVVLVYLAGYGTYWKGHTLLDFIRLHFMQILFYRSYVPEYPKFEIFRIIFFGLWRKWFDDFGLAKVDQWTVLWPVGLILSVLSLAGKSLKKTPNPQLLLALWVGIWILFISLKIVFPRYLLVALPAVYILSTFALEKIITKTAKIVL